MGVSYHCYCFGCSSDRTRPHSKQYWRETSGNSTCTLCSAIKSSSRFDYLYWQIYLLFPPWNTTWHGFYPINPKARAKMAGILNKVYWLLKQAYFNVRSLYIEGITIHPFCPVSYQDQRLLSNQLHCLRNSSSQAATAGSLLEKASAILLLIICRGLPNKAE